MSSYYLKINQVGDKISIQEISDTKDNLDTADALRISNNSFQDPRSEKIPPLIQYLKNGGLQGGGVSKKRKKKNKNKKRTKRNF